MTPPVPDTPPLPAQPSLGMCYSASASPSPDHGPVATSDQSYFFQQTPYRSQYVSPSLPSLDPLDSGNNYVTATALSSAGPYDNLFSHPLSQSSSSSPMVTPADSPMVSTGLTLPFTATNDQFLDPSSSFAPAFSEQSAFGTGNMFTPSFDPSRTSSFR